MIKISADILIIGGGVGGVAAAYAAAKYASGKKVVLIEAQPVLGGTSTIGGVNAWEPGCVGNSELHYVLYNRLSAIKKAHICKYTRKIPAPFVTAYVEGTDDAVYTDTYTRRGGRRVVFAGDAMADALKNVLYEFNNLTVITCCVFCDSKISNGRIVCVNAIDTLSGELIEINSDLYIDATAEIELCRMSGCCSERSEYLNGVSQMYVVCPKNYREIEKIPKWVLNTEAVEWINRKDPDTIFNYYPDGRLNANTLCTLDGDEYIKMGTQAKKNAVARTYMVWNELQKNHGMDDYILSYIFPVMGVREGYRLKGQYVLTAEELVLGHNLQNKNDHFIAIGDHALDLHKSGDNKLFEMTDYYGVPYECTLTNEIDNLAAVSRGISLTHEAASSCRLQRTIMQIGEGVGKAAARAKKSFNEKNIFETL